MKKISQSEHIGNLINESTERKRKVSKIQQSYDDYTLNRSEHNFTEMIQLLDDYCIPWVRKHLWSSGCYSEENEHTALQESRIAIWLSITKNNNQDEIRNCFAYYAFGIYKKKTLDIIRKISKKRIQLEIVSIDDPVGTEGKQLIDYLPYVQPKLGEQDEIRQIYEGVFRIYCISFMNSKTFPPRCLALYYARVLPHLLEEIPDSKATSAKWAVERIGNRSVAELTQESEKTLQNDIDKELAWGIYYIKQLDDEIDIQGEKCQLRRVIYTRLYDKSKIEDWADYMHKVALRTSTKLLLEDQKLLELVKEYVSTDSFLQRFMG